MPYSLINRWRLPLLLVIVCALFAWVFTISIDHAQKSQSQALSLETTSPDGPLSIDLELSTRLEPRTEASPSSRRILPSPAPWWPVLLFALAFCGGWFYRHVQGVSGTHNVRASAETDELASDRKATQTAADDTVSSQPNSHSTFIKAIATGTVPDLAKDFPWDENALNNTAHLSSEERIARLETQNASKAEIIKALEKLVTENREKWLHQDETEARLNSHISELSADLEVAIRQLQQLQEGTRSRRSTPRKDAI